MAANELVRETAWSREYRLGPETFSFESKFVKDGLEVSVETVRNNWLQWALPEQLSFATAFILKPALTSQDQEILTFLMEHGPAPVWAIIAHRLPQHSDREGTVVFLLARVAAKDTPGTNYFHALASIGDPRAVQPLRQRYLQLREFLTPFEEHDFGSQIADYLACCGALWRLTNSPEYPDALRQLSSHPDAAVRHAAQKEYVEKKLHYIVSAGAPERPPAGPGASDELIKETKWSRVYRRRSGYCWYASKFRTDGLQIAAASIWERWPRLELEERVEFAQAFCQKSTLNGQDWQILQLLLEEGSEYIRTVVAFQLGAHPGLENVLPFILEGIGAPEQQAVKYYETLRLIGDARAVPLLRQRYEQYRKEQTDLPKSKIEDLAGYLLCCQALRTLTGSIEYEAALEELLIHPDKSVRREVRRLLPRKKS